MINNRFYNARKEIKAISEKHNVTVDVATQMYIQEHKLTDCNAELAAWTAECNRYMRDKTLTLADLFR